MRDMFEKLDLGYELVRVSKKDQEANQTSQGFLSKLEREHQRQLENKSKMKEIMAIRFKAQMKKREDKAKEYQKKKEQALKKEEKHNETQQAEISRIQKEIAKNKYGSNYSEEVARDLKAELLSLRTNKDVKEHSRKQLALACCQKLKELYFPNAEDAEP